MFFTAFAHHRKIMIQYFTKQKFELDMLGLLPSISSRTNRAHTPQFKDIQIFLNHRNHACMFCGKVGVQFFIQFNNTASL